MPQSGVTHVQYGKNISLPAVGATFETTVSHLVIQNAQNTSVTKETLKDDFSINMYLDASTRDKQPTKPKSSVINFSTYKLRDNQSTCELAKHVDEPVVKKRKINIVSSGIDSYFAGSSTSSSIVTENGSVNLTHNDKEENKDNKKALGKQYLKDVSI